MSTAQKVVWRCPECGMVKGKALYGWHWDEREGAWVHSACGAIYCAEQTYA